MSIKPVCLAENISNKKVEIKVVQQGRVKICGNNEGYWRLGNDEAVCFFFDVCEKASVMAYSSNEYDEPSLFLCESDDDDEEITVVSFPEYAGWSVHACGDGGSIAVALVNRKWVESCE